MPALRRDRHLGLSSPRPICGRAGIRTQAFNYVFKYSLFPWELVSVDFNSPGAETVLLPLLYLAGLAQQRRSGSAK